MPDLSKCPRFLGKPSPSLRRIERANGRGLQRHITQLDTEAARIEAKADRLAQHQPPPAAQIQRLRTLAQRLRALSEEAQQRFDRMTGGSGNE